MEEQLVYDPQCHNGCPHHNGVGCWVSQDCHSTEEIVVERRRYKCLEPGTYEDYLRKE